MRIVEPFAGLGAYSLYAIAQQASRMDHRHYREKPPYSRMGSKAGFAPSVFRAWNLSRQPVTGVWLNDLCTVCQALWLSYASADFRDAVAARVAAMTPCRQCQPDAVAAALRGEIIPTPETLTGMMGCPECAGTGVRDARLWWEECRSAPVPEFGVDLGAVGAFLQARAYGLLPIGAGFDGWTMMQSAANPKLGRPQFKPERDDDIDDRPNPAGSMLPRFALAHRFSTLPSPHNIPMHLTGLDASLVLPEGDASDTFVVIDPPYEATTGYASTSARSTVIALTRAWHEAGALVLIHEAAPLADELGNLWQSRPAGPLRRKASNFWKGGEEREWVTFNRAPVWWPEQQMGLF